MEQVEVVKQMREAAPQKLEKHWVGQFARIGYLAIGVVYVVLATLAELAAVGVGGSVSGPGGAARTLVAQPYGKAMLGVVAAGLLVFVAWRMAQSVFDVEDRGTVLHGLTRRLALLMSGLSYLGLAVVAAEYVVLGQGRLQDPKTEWTARLMEHSAGTYAATVIGAAVAGVGVYHLYGAARAGFTRFLHTDPMHTHGEHVVTALGRLGLASRGVVFCIVGGFLAVSGWQIGPDRPLGIGGVLRFIMRQPFGHALLGVMAAGLLAYGIFMLAKVRYRSIAPILAGEDEEGEVRDDEGGDAERRSATTANDR